MPIWSKTDAAPQDVAVLLFDRFSNLCLANAVEPLRAANFFAGRPVYRWRFVTLDGSPVASSSNIPIATEDRLRPGEGGDLLIVLASYDYRRHATAKCAAALRQAARDFKVVAGLDAGSWLMADAGLLDGREATFHWTEIDNFAERFPDVTARRVDFIVDGDRITCAGGATALDLMLFLIAARHGEALRLDVVGLFQPDTQPSALALRPGRSRTVARAIALMRSALEDPLPIGEIARRLGRTQRDLETRFKRDISADPRTVYRRLRLAEARTLSQFTELPVSEIAIRCGYRNPSALTRAFRQEFGTTPRAMRHSI